MVIARVTPLAAARGFRSSHQKPPAGADGMDPDLVAGTVSAGSGAAGGSMRNTRVSGDLSSTLISRTCRANGWPVTTSSTSQARGRSSFRGPPAAEWMATRLESASTMSSVSHQTCAPASRAAFRQNPAGRPGVEVNTLVHFEPSAPCRSFTARPARSRPSFVQARPSAWPSFGRSTGPYASGRREQSPGSSLS